MCISIGRWWDAIADERGGSLKIRQPAGMQRFLTWLPDLSAVTELNMSAAAKQLTDAAALMLLQLLLGLKAIDLGGLRMCEASVLEI